MVLTSWYQSSDSATTMANSSNKNTKETLNPSQLMKEKDQIGPFEPEIGASSERTGVVDGVQSALEKMNANLENRNANLENMIGCFYRMTHDRGKEVDRRVNGGVFRELGNITHREAPFHEDIGVQSQIKKLNRGIGSHFGQIESNFDLMANRIWCSTPTAMDSGDRDLVISIGDVQYPITEEVLHQIFDSFGSFEIIDLFSLKNGDVQAHIGFRCSSSATWAKLSLQGRCIYTGCCQMEIEFYKQQQGGMNPIVTNFHRVIEKPNAQLSDCETNCLENCNDHTVFKEKMAEVEAGDVVVETEVILGDEEHVNARNVMNCDVAYTISGVEVSAGCFIVADIAGQKDATVASNRNEKIAGEMVMLQGKIKGDVARTELDHSELDVDAKNLDWKFVNIEHIKVKRINGDFEDPFDVSPNSVQTQKIQLMLAVEMDKSMREVKCLLADGCEVCMVQLCFQDSCAAVKGVQWWRRGVG